jgi:hypothetical protein
VALYSVALYSVADDRDGKHSVKYRLMNRGDYPVDNVMLLMANPGTESVTRAGKPSGTACAYRPCHPYASPHRVRGLSANGH